MGTSAALNIAAAAGGITEGIRTGLLLKEDKRRDKEVKAKEDFEKRVKDYYANKQTEKNMASPGVDAHGSPMPGNPNPDQNPDGTPRQGVKTTGAEGEAKPDADGFTYNPAKYANMPDSMKGLRDAITESEDLAQIALDSGLTEEAVQYKREARETARLVETMTDRSLADEERKLRIQNIAESRRGIALVDTYDAAMAGDLTHASNRSWGGTSEEKAAKDGTFKVDKEKGTVSYETVDGKPRIITKTERDQLARKLNYGTEKKGSTADLRWLADSYKEELQGIKTTLGEMDARMRAKLQKSKDSPEELQAYEEATRAQRMELKKKRNELESEVKRLTKAIRQGVDASGSESGEPTNSDAPSGDGEMMSQQDFVADFQAEEGRAPTPEEIARAKGKYWR